MSGPEHILRKCCCCPPQMLSSQGPSFQVGSGSAVNKLQVPHWEDKELPTIIIYSAEAAVPGAACQPTQDPQLPNCAPIRGTAITCRLYRPGWRGHPLRFKSGCPIFPMRAQNTLENCPRFHFAYNWLMWTREVGSAFAKVGIILKGQPISRICRNPGAHGRVETRSAEKSSASPH